MVLNLVYVRVVFCCFEKAAVRRTTGIQRAATCSAAAARAAFLLLHYLRLRYQTEGLVLLHFKMSRRKQTKPSPLEGKL